MARALLCLVAVAACSGGKTTTTVEKKDAAVARDLAEAVVAIPERTLGLPDFVAYGWRQRAGQAAFREARTAEAREDWAAVVTACEQALAADPGHLEASWLYAAALGRLGRTGEVLAPLHVAVAGDFGKWGDASLELPALETFRATPTGIAWKNHLEDTRGAYVAALARSTLVLAGGDVYAVHVETNRWYRMTRTGGVVIAGVPSPATRKLAYVARVGTKGKRELGVGVIDLARGRTTRPALLGAGGPIAVAYSAKAPVGFWVGMGAAKLTWRHLEDDYKLVAVPAKAVRPAGNRLDVKSTSGRRTALPLANVTADWDENGLASAVRIGSSNRIVSVPSPGLIDGNTASWSPSKSHLAFVAQLDETCEPGTISAAAFIADATTGKVSELERATKGLAIDWVTDRKVAIAGDNGVSIVDLDGAPPRIIEGAKKLLVPKKRARCTEEPDPDPIEDPEVTDSSHGGPLDAGVVEPPGGVKPSPP